MRSLVSYLCVLGIWALAGMAGAQTIDVERTTAILDTAPAEPHSTNEIANHVSLYAREPDAVLRWPPAPPIDPALAAIARLDAQTNEFEAPPLIVTRLTSLAPSSGDDTNRILDRFEWNLLRERIELADRMYRNGDVTNAVVLMVDTGQYIKNPRNRLVCLNRLAAYHFRARNYEASADVMSQAMSLDPQDVATAINLSAILMTMGRLDEALDRLLKVYPHVLDRPKLFFSVHFNLACVYSMKGIADRALQNLALAAQSDPASTLASIGDAQLDAIRRDPRFAELSRSLEAFVFHGQPPR